MRRHPGPGGSTTGTGIGLAFRMNLLTLPHDLRRAFDSIEPVLTRYFGPKGYRLGGGTVLQALWLHRRSTDLDFFVELSHFRSTRLAIGKPIEEVLGDEASVSEADGDDGERGAQAIWQGTPVEFVTLDNPLRLDAEIPGRARRRVGSTDVEAEWPTEILARKLKDRVWRRGVVTIRDLIDIGTAKVAAPDALGRALATLRPVELDEVATYLRSLGRDWIEDEQVGERPLLDWRPISGMPTALADWPGAVAAIIEEGTIVLRGDSGTQGGRHG